MKERERYILSDEELIKVYKKLSRLHLGPSFIRLIENEIRYRGLDKKIQKLEKK